MIATAAGDVWMARVAALARTRERAVARRRVAVIDELLGVLELGNLRRERSIDRLLRARLRRLEAEVGLPLPRRVVRARNTVRLHAALLDWQQLVLDTVVPERLLLPDLDRDVAEEDPADQPA